MVDRSVRSPLNIPQVSFVTGLWKQGPTYPQKYSEPKSCKMDEEMEEIRPEDEHTSWSRLPFELHRKVLQVLAHDELKSKLLAEYAVVCKSWQVEIEEINFSKLKLKPDDINKLDMYVTGRRRAYLKHLWLSIELDKYPSRLRITPENEFEQESNNFTFTASLFNLFQVLEDWDTPEFWTQRHGRGLSLEVSAHSPSDKRQLFGEAGLDPDGCSRFFDAMLDFFLVAINDPQGIHGLPMVNVVTALCILRRNYRNIAPTALVPMTRSLPRLEELRFETWQQTEHTGQRDVDCELASQLPLWSTTMKRLSIFEHFGVFDTLEPWDSPRHDRLPFLAHGLRRHSLQLEELSASFVADAYDFFEPFMARSGALPNGNPTSNPRLPSWPNLRWLTLTSRRLSPHEFPDQINGLLLAAGKAARNMPRLQAMEIYNANRFFAAVFRYLVVDNMGVISWTSTWKDVKLAPAVIAAWRVVAVQGTRQEPVVFPEVTMPNYRGGPEGFIHSELATRDLVLHSVSSKLMMSDRPYPEPVLRLKNV